MDCGGGGSSRSLILLGSANALDGHCLSAREEDSAEGAGSFACSSAHVPLPARRARWSALPHVAAAVGSARTPVGQCVSSSSPAYAQCVCSGSERLASPRGDVAACAAPHTSRNVCGPTPRWRRSRRRVHRRDRHRCTAGWQRGAPLRRRYFARGRRVPPERTARLERLASAALDRRGLCHSRPSSACGTRSRLRHEDWTCLRGNETLRCGAHHGATDPSCTQQRRVATWPAEPA